MNATKEKMSITIHANFYGPGPDEVCSAFSSFSAAVAAENVRLSGDGSSPLAKQDEVHLAIFDDEHGAEWFSISRGGIPLGEVDRKPTFGVVCTFAEAQIHEDWFHDWRQSVSHDGERWVLNGSED